MQRHVSSPSLCGIYEAQNPHVHCTGEASSITSWIVSLAALQLEVNRPYRVQDTQGQTTKLMGWGVEFWKETSRKTVKRLARRTSLNWIEF